MTQKPEDSGAAEESQSKVGVQSAGPVRLRLRSGLDDDEKGVRRTRGRPFRRGQSGNPAGRPKGSKNATTLAAEALLHGEAEALTRIVVEMALGGDKFALALCLDRILPRARDRIVTFSLPPLVTLEDAPKAIAAIMAAVAGGRLTPAEADQLGRLVDGFVRATTAANLERREQERCEKGARPFVVRLASGLEKL